MHRFRDGDVSARVRQKIPFPGAGAFFAAQALMDIPIDDRVINNSLNLRK